MLFPMAGDEFFQVFARFCDVFPRELQKPVRDFSSCRQQEVRGAPDRHDAGHV
jgi:hypothetical protein